MTKLQEFYRWIRVREVMWSGPVFGYDHETSEELGGVLDEMEKRWPQLKDFAAEIDEQKVFEEAKRAWQGE